MTAVGRTSIKQQLYFEIETGEGSNHLTSQYTNWSIDQRMDFSVNKKCPFVWLFFLCLILSLPAHAGSPVWEVEKNGNKIFLGGTFHILTPEDYPLPAAFEDAYSQSTQIVFETDMVKLQSPGFQRVMLRQLTYSDGRNLQQVVSNSTYLALEEFFTARGIPMASIVNFKPGMVVTMMTIVELHRLGLVGVGVDTYFNEKAVNDRKTLGQLETVEEQLEFISNMGIGKEDEMLAYNLTDIEKLPTFWQLLKTAWRNGEEMAPKN